MADEITLTLEPPYIGSAYSPQVTVEEIEGGHSVTITSDVPGEGIVAQTFGVLNGDASQAIEDAEAAAAAARAAATSASSAATSATNAAGTASTAAGQASTAAGAATDAASAATGAAASATAAAADATEAAGLADDATAAATAAASNAGTATREAIAATTGANNAAATANAAAGSATDAASAAATAAGTATDAAASATDAASAAGTAATAANTAATAANAAAETATEAAEGITDAWLPRVTVGASDGITGGGPLDTAAWLSRACPGTDGPATIESIHGRTVRWNQLAGDFGTYAYVNSNVSSSVTDNVITVEKNNASSSWANVTYTLPDVTSGHVFLMKASFSGNTNGERVIAFLVDGSTAGTYTTEASGIIKLVTTASTNVCKLRFYACYRSATSYEPTPITYSNIQLFDLTAMFGAGNEPSTVAEFEALYPDAYYPYDAGSLLPVRMTGVESVGFNQFDEQWQVGGIAWATGAETTNTNSRRSGFIPVFPDTDYHFHSSGSTLGFVWYDANKAKTGSIGTSITDATKTSPSDARYVRIAGSDALESAQVCINLSGPRNGEYEPHWHFQRAIDAGVLRGAGTAYDELTATEHITRVGERAYESGDESDPSVITDGTTTHYALATPTTTPLDPALNMTYKAAAGGTERILHDEPTAPPMLVIQYGSTADGIRDRALEAIAAHDGPVAQTYHAVGSYLTLGGSLYKVTRAIAAGERIASGTNVTATTVMAEVLALTQ